MSKFENITPEQIVMLSSFAALALTEDMNVNDMNTLGNLIAAVGAAILARAAQTQNLENKQDIIQQIQDHQAEIEKLNKQLC